jgi:hypothetical protein
MSATPFTRLIAITALTAAAAAAQGNVLVTVQPPSSKLLVSGSMQVAGFITTIDGTPLDAGSLTWSSSDSTVASVSSSGMVTGLMPGDVQISVTDSNTSVAASTIVHVVPASLSLQVSVPTITAGDTAQLSASALDAAGHAISGLRFQYRSGQAGVATVSSDGVVTGVAEGFVTLQATIAGVVNDPALAATTRIRILPKSRYKLRKVVSTGTPGTTTIAAVTSLSAANSSEIAALVTLNNGGQAAVLQEGAKTTVIAAAGQPMPNTGRMVLRIDGISANSRGDVALAIEYPNQWCAMALFLIPHGQPEIELADVTNCGISLATHSLGDDGKLLYRINDQIWSASAKSTPVMLFSLATQPTLKDPLRSVYNFVAGGGAYIIGGPLASGATGYFWSDGSKFQQVYRSGDLFRDRQSQSMDVPLGSASGQFYARGNGAGYEALVQLGAAGLQTLLITGDPVSGGQQGWIQGMVDASSAGVLFVSDFSPPNNFHRSAAIWQNNLVTEVVPLDGWAAVVSGALPADGVAILSAALNKETNIPGLRAFPPQADPRMILAAGSNFPQPVAPGIDWHYPSRGGAGTVLPVRAAGEAIVTVDTAAKTIVSIGATLPNGRAAMSIGAAMANTAGDIVFTAGYPTGSGIFRYRGGKLETLADSAVTGLSALSTPSWVSTWRGRYLATNNRGDIVHNSQYQNGVVPWIVAISGGVPKLVAALNTNAPGGGPYSSFNTQAMDDNGRVLYTATTNDGKNGIYFWDGNTVQRVIGIGDQTPSGTVNEVSNISGAGQGFLIMLAFDNYRARELRYFDGKMRTLESTDTSLLDGTWLNYFWMNEATLSANGDAHYQVQTQDGGAGVYARRADGTLAVVARSRDQLPTGDWLIFPLTVSSGPAGEVWFTAYVWNNGVESLALFEATPQ